MIYGYKLIKNNLEADSIDRGRLKKRILNKTESNNSSININKSNCKSESRSRSGRRRRQYSFYEKLDSGKLLYIFLI